MINKLGEFVKQKFTLSIVADDDLIIYLDERIRESAYSPHRFVGSTITVALVASGQSDDLAEIFHRQTGEKKNRFRNKLKGYLSDPKTYNVFVVSIEKQRPLALLVLSEKGQHILDIPLIRTADDALSPFLEPQLLFWAVKQAENRERIFIQVTDNNLFDSTIQALKENLFLECSDGWLKINIQGIHKIVEFESLLEQYKVSIGEASVAFSTCFNQLENIITQLQEVANEEKVRKLFELEKTLWPAKVNDVEIPAFLVPINPLWARDLFDYKLGNQTLFGSDSALILKMENVYYRSANTKLPSAPSRVLWYVTKDGGQYQDVMAVRACSYVEETVIAPPKEQFKQFGESGVYKWQDVFSTAGGDLNKNVLAFRFSHTELFEHHVTLRELKEITGRNMAPMAPQRISNKMFVEIYQRGTKKE